MGFKVHVQPVASMPSGFEGGLFNQFFADALPLEIWMNGGVQQEGMHPSVPCHIDKTHQLISSVGCHMAQVSLQNRRKIMWHMAFPGKCK